MNIPSLPAISKPVTHMIVSIAFCIFSHGLFVACCICLTLSFKKFNFVEKSEDRPLDFYKADVSGWDNIEAEKLFASFCQETAFDKRYELLEQFQDLVYDEVPYIKVGDYKNLRISNNKVHGFANELYLYFFNVWKEK